MAQANEIIKQRRKAPSAASGKAEPYHLIYTYIRGKSAFRVYTPAERPYRGRQSARETIKDCSRSLSRPGREQKDEGASGPAAPYPIAVITSASGQYWAERDSRPREKDQDGRLGTVSLAPEPEARPALLLPRLPSGRRVRGVCRAAIPPDFDGTGRRRPPVGRAKIRGRSPVVYSDLR